MPADIIILNNVEYNKGVVIISTTRTTLAVFDAFDMYPTSPYPENQRF